MIDIEGTLISLLGKREKYKVGLFGTGMTTLSLLDALLPLSSVEITVRDEGAAAVLPKVCRARVFSGAAAFEAVNEDILILSPSVRREREEFQAVKKRGTLLTSECEMFFLSSPPAIGITGSDGKSTTTVLTEALLKNAGHATAAVGNIGIPYSSADCADIYVSELSSFNLSYFSPRLRAAAITNIEENHLNWHSSYDEYVGAKRNILKNAERTVLSADCEETLKIIKENGASAVFSTRLPFSELKALPAESFFTHEASAICKNGAPLSYTSHYLRSEDYVIKNMLTAAALTDGLVSSLDIDSTFSTFSGLADRCELIYESGGVSFYNSSIDTSPARCAVTLRALGKPVRLLLGGRGKGLSYKPLIEPIAKYARLVAVYGDASEDIRRLFSECSELRNIPLICRERFDGAFSALTEGLSNGDTVLLSPAATAYGEFRNYRERAERFKALTKDFIKRIT